ncbi:alkylglycerol monooxygenase-like [Stegodyphus dumicola]|uniref:alkylglycerol monooxygenase-like n=1 Tax=Stegodyphus dumicola TaxID=202533 RepID=UPI0015AA227F|nr:alkylglycerol monooxygenase-like [Stegodyphus dumicola]
MRLNDSVTNISQGILVELFKIPLFGTELIMYTYIYNNWRIYALPWDSVWTWILCMIVTDFCFYWMHRATHQVSILWVFHEPHHSSEEFNLTVPLRLSVFTSAALWLTYVPMAFFIPPSIYLVHYQMNIIFQYWLHTELIISLGVIEYVFVTPSHHRVHHGRNRRCIDKNFGSLFILWDRIFGTFEPEGNKAISYGVTQPIQTFNPISIQTNHLQTIWKRLHVVDGFFNKLCVIFKGPGWSPGKPWLGYLEDIPEPKDAEAKYDPSLPNWLQLYVLLHGSAMVTAYLLMILNLSIISTYVVIISGCSIAFTTVALGCLLDLSVWGPIIELLRCPLYFLAETMIRKEFPSTFYLLHASMYGFRILFFISFVFWIFALPFVTNINWKKAMKG